MNPKGVLAKMTCAIVTQDNYTPMSCVMFYDQTRPLEVMFGSVENTIDGEPAEWYYARDLLHEALAGEEEVRYGEGDVVVFKAQNFLFTVLTAGELSCCVAFMKADMETFLKETEKLVPFGQEVITEEEIDDVIARILGEAN
jgi:hypothetical protein